MPEVLGASGGTRGSTSGGHGSEVTFVCAAALSTPRQATNTASAASGVVFTPV